MLGKSSNSITICGGERGGGLAREYDSNLEKAFYFGDMLINYNVWCIENGKGELIFKASNPKGGMRSWMVYINLCLLLSRPVSSGGRIKYRSGVFRISVEYRSGVFRFYRFRINPTGLEQFSRLFLFLSKIKNSAYLLLKIICIQ